MDTYKSAAEGPADRDLQQVLFTALHADAVGARRRWGQLTTDPILERQVSLDQKVAIPQRRQRDVFKRDCLTTVHREGNISTDLVGFSQQRVH